MNHPAMNTAPIKATITPMLTSRWLRMIAVPPSMLIARSVGRMASRVHPLRCFQSKLDSAKPPGPCIE
jgi:hypothetical protein